MYHVSMTKRYSKKLLIKTKDRDLINEIRRTFGSTEISVNNNDSRSADLIIIDKRDGREIPNDTKWNCKIICIINKISKEEIEMLTAQGADHILTLPEFKFWLFCLIKKYLGYLEVTGKEYRYKGITICRDKSAIIYNNCKVLLTNQELNTFEDIVKRESPYCKIENPSTKSTISRINRKTKKSTGIKIIGNRYNHGYYISV